MMWMHTADCVHYSVGNSHCLQSQLAIPADRFLQLVNLFTSNLLHYATISHIAFVTTDPVLDVSLDLHSTPHAIFRITRHIRTIVTLYACLSKNACAKYGDWLPEQVDHSKITKDKHEVN